ncbi:MAG: HAD family hydrolase [Bacteroidetes bacterium]|nr:HAD family hydrolase [Bacteroidota bacterium]MBU1113940.1 HAD family hydrolase [Bacteroidota bacterium]MBU1798265.1 HAD family hydrolase [Bacteroidota bacterium]
MNIEKYKHVIWDWNGTLFDDVELCSKIMNQLLEEANLPKITVNEYRAVFTFPVIDYYKALGHDVGDENWQKISHQFISEYEANKYNYSIYGDAKDVLTKIKNLGISQSVLSAYKQETLDELVAHFGLSEFFVGLIGLDNIYATSKLDNGLKWMKKLGFKKGEVLFVGDTLHDCEVANAIGADPVLITLGHQSIDKLKSCKIKLIDSLSELITPELLANSAVT